MRINQDLLLSSRLALEYHTSVSASIGDLGLKTSISLKFIMICRDDILIRTEQLCVRYMISLNSGKQWKCNEQCSMTGHDRKIDKCIVVICSCHVSRESRLDINNRYATYYRVFKNIIA